MGAIASLRFLNGSTRALATTQNRVSTGLKVTGAKEDASNFAIAQGIRTDIKAVGAVMQSLNSAKGAVGVAISAATAVSDMITLLKQKAIERSNPGNTTEQSEILDSDISKIIEQMQQFVDNANFNGDNLLKGQLIGTLTQLWFAPRVVNDIDGDLALDQGESTMARPFASTGADPANVQLTDYRIYIDGNLEGLTVNGPVTAVAANSTDQSISLFSTATTGFNPLTAQQIHLDYTIRVDGYTVDGSLDWGYGDEPINNGSQPHRAFNGIANGAEKFTFLSDDVGNSFEISRQPIGVDILGLDSLDFINFSTTSMQVIDEAADIVNRRLAYLGGQANKIERQVEFMEIKLDAIAEGLGNIVDADMARESARLIQRQIQTQLATNVLRDANKSPSIIGMLFNAII